MTPLRRWTLLLVAVGIVLGAAVAAVAPKSRTAYPREPTTTAVSRSRAACQLEPATTAALQLLHPNPNVTAIADRIQAVLKECTGLTRQPESTAHADLRARTINRLKAQLRAIPRRWEAMQRPVVPISGRLGLDVLRAASPDERRAAVELTLRTVIESARNNESASDPTALAALAHGFRHDRTLNERTLTEADLWMPAQLAFFLNESSGTLAGLFIETSLTLGQHARRRDVLLNAAGKILWALPRFIGPDDLVDIAELWSELPYNRSAQSEQQGAAMVRLGNAVVLYYLSDKARALAMVQAARNLHQAAGDESGDIHSRIIEARILSLGNTVKALEVAKISRLLYQAGDSKLGEGYSRLVESRVLRILGYTAKALASTRKARALFQAAGSKRGEGKSRLDEAQILLRLGDTAGALAGSRSARALYRAVGNKFGESRSWLLEARALSLQGDTAAALHGFRTARALYQTIDSKSGEGETWLAEAEVLLRLGDTAGALLGFRAACALFRAAGNRSGEGRSRRGEAAVYERLGQLAQAHATAAVAVHLLQQDDAYDDDELHARIALARILAALGRERQAMAAAEQAIKVLRRWRHRGTTDLDRTVHANVASPYDFLVPFLARSPDHASTAVYWAELAHAPVLLDLITIQANEQQRHLCSPVPTSPDVMRLRAELLKIDQKLQASDSDRERKHLQEQRRKLDWQLELHELAARAEQELVTGQPLTRTGIRDLVERIGPTLLYYVAQDETVAFLLRPGQRAPLVHRIAQSRAALNKQVHTLRHHLGNQFYEHRAQTHAQALYDLLIAPFAPALDNAPQLTIIPHGPLHQLPFAALRDHRNRPLFERWHVSVAPSLSVLHALRQRAPQRDVNPAELSFFGLAAGTGLHFPDREVQEVAALFPDPAVASLQHQSTFVTYQHNAPQTEHMLISTHGVYVPQSRRGTYLEINPSTNHDRRLHAGEIACIPLQAQLVVLSACDSATGEALLSDERLDITRAFLIAGAGAVIATRWQIPDTADTRQFLIDFYWALQRGGPGGHGLRKDHALTYARRQARARGVASNIWAAWTLIGDAR